MFIIWCPHYIIAHPHLGMLEIPTPRGPRLIHLGRWWRRAPSLVEVTSPFIQMYVCIYLSIYLCIYVSMDVCMYACIDVCMHVCMCACMPVCMYACMYGCMYVCMHACIHVWMHVIVHVHLYIYIYASNSGTKHSDEHDDEPPWSSAMLLPTPVSGWWICQTWKISIPMSN